MKSIIQYFYLSLYIIHCPSQVSCQNNSAISNKGDSFNNIIQTNVKETKLTLEKELFEIVTQDTPAYNIFSTRTIDNQVYLAYFGHTKKEIKITNINECKIVKIVDLKNRIDKENTLESFYFHNFDTIFLHQKKEIAIIDTAGNEKFGTPINNTSRRKMNISNFGNGNPISFDPLNKKILLGQYCSSCYAHEKKFYQQNILTTLDSKTGIFKEIPFAYPNVYSIGFYGFAIYSYHLLKDSLSIVSFQADPNIYILNRNNNKVTVVGGQSKFHSTINELPLQYKDDTNKKMEHLTEAPLYLTVHWDPYRKLYYRFFLKELPKKNKDGSYNGWSKKQSILMVFDEGFNLLKEVEMENYLSQYHHAFVAPQGLFVRVMDPSALKKSNKNILFEIYKFKP